MLTGGGITGFSGGGRCLAGDAEVWNHTVNESLRFSSDPRVGRLLALTLKNWQLIVLTLDFYWRFAAMATARMRIEADVASPVGNRIRYSGRVSA